jgi:hypothetical protein
MARTTSTTFSLRFREERIRNLVREVSAREGISQNEFLEQAAEHEVIARGALLVSDLESAAARLRSGTQEVLALMVERSISDFAIGEAHPDPIRTIQHSAAQPVGEPDVELGAVAAFLRT